MNDSFKEWFETSKRSKEIRKKLQPIADKIKTIYPPTIPSKQSNKTNNKQP